MERDLIEVIRRLLAMRKGYYVYGFHAFEWERFTKKPLKRECYLGACVSENRCVILF